MEAPPSNTLYINNIQEKVQIDVLKKMFYMVFSQYGRVTDIVAHKGVKLRGQAWVVFHDVASATAALRAKQGFNFYGKPLRIAYAKDKSSSSSSSSSGSSSSGAGGADGNGHGLKRRREDGGEDDDDDDEGASKLPRVMANDVPNRLLLAHSLPAGVDAAALRQLFTQCVGFQDVRDVPGNAAIAFVEFGDETQAGMALRQLHGFQLSPTDALQLTYAK